MTGVSKYEIAHAHAMAVAADARRCKGKSVEETIAILWPEDTMTDVRMKEPKDLTNEELIAEVRRTAGYMGYAETQLEIASRFSAALKREREDVDAIQWVLLQEEGRMHPSSEGYLRGRLAAREKPAEPENGSEDK